MALLCWLAVVVSCNVRVCRSLYEDWLELSLFESPVVHPAEPRESDIKLSSSGQVDRLSGSLQDAISVVLCNSEV